MHISVVTMPVSDVDRAIDFYTHTLGWEKTMDVEMEMGRWVTVAPKGAQTALTLSAYSEGRKPGGMSGVVIEVDDAYASCQELKRKGVEFPEEPSNQPWGVWAMFKDSEGNVHGLHSAVPASVSSN